MSATVATDRLFILVTSSRNSWKMTSGLTGSCATEKYRKTVYYDVGRVESYIAERQNYLTD